jgi:hypothetical protein
MLALIGKNPLVLIALVALGCAGHSPSTHPIDSAGGADYDEMFLEIHMNIMGELAELEKTEGKNPELIEIQSMVKTAEEFYLEGRPLIAIKLLTEAELLLKQVPRYE